MVRVTCLSPTKNYSYCSSLLFSSCSLGILDSSNFKQRSFYSKQTSGKHTKQTTSTTKNNTPKQKKGLKRTYRKIGLVATVTRTQETQKTELRLKRYNYRKICVIKETKELYFIYFN